MIGKSIQFGAKAVLMTRQRNLMISIYCFPFKPEKKKQNKKKQKKKHKNLCVFKSFQYMCMCIICNIVLIINYHLFVAALYLFYILHMFVGKQHLILFVLRLNVPVNTFSVMSGWSHRFLGN